MAAATGTDRVEPNLTPLLDVVLQLIMFFMITVNFVSDQINQNVLLPTSESATEIMAKGDMEKLVMNLEVVRQDKRDSSGQLVLDEHGRSVRELVKPLRMRIIFAGSETIEFNEGQELVGLGKAQKALATQADDTRVRTARRLGKDLKAVAELEKHVIIRADVEAHYGLVYPLIAQCQKEGFSKVEVGVLSKAK